MLGKAHRGGAEVILIQDAHANPSAQFNIAKTLEILSPNYVFLEGGYLDNSLSFLKKYSTPQRRQQATESFVYQGKLQGVEYQNIVGNKDFTIWGVEQLPLYSRSIAAYRAVVKDREKFENYLQRVESTTNTLKPQIYNPLLLSWDRKYQSYQKENLPLTEYFEVLKYQVQIFNLSLSAYPHLKALNELKDLEQRIDFKKASEEEQNAVESLSEADRKELAESLKENASPFKLSLHEKAWQNGFFALLEEKVKTKSYPELSKYFDYLKKAKKLNFKAILEDQKKLENDFFEKMTTDEDERNLIQASQNLAILKKLLNLTLTPDEFDAYKNKKEGFSVTRMTGFLNKKIMELKDHYDRAVFLEEGYEPIVKHAEEFYELTYERDQKFIENMLKKMNDTKPAVLIAGGYHTPNLKYLLKQQNISYISITPQITQETNQALYEKLLLNQTIDTKFSQLPYITQSPLASTMDFLAFLVKSATEAGVPAVEFSNALASNPEEQPVILQAIQDHEPKFGGPSIGTGGVGSQDGRPRVEATPQYALAAARLAMSRRDLLKGTVGVAASAVINPLVSVFGEEGNSGRSIEYAIDEKTKTWVVKVDGKALDRKDRLGAMVYTPAYDISTSEWDKHVPEFFAALFTESELFDEKGQAKDAAIRALPAAQQDAIRKRAMGHAKDLQSMGVKNIRTYYLPVGDSKQVDAVKALFRRLHRDYGIGVTGGHWIGFWNKSDAPGLTNKTDWAVVKESLHAFVRAYAGEPWLDTINLGNEHNYFIQGGSGQKGFPAKEDRFTTEELIRYEVEMAAEVILAQRELNRERAAKGLKPVQIPVSIALGGLTDEQALFIKKYNDLKAKEIGERPVKAISSNLYPGVDHKKGTWNGDISLLERAAASAAKAELPLIIQEIGFPNTDANGNKQYERQLEFMRAAQKVIENNPTIIRATWFQYNDNAWKGGQVESHFGITPKLRETGLFASWKFGTQTSATKPGRWPASVGHPAGLKVQNPEGLNIRYGHKPGEKYSTYMNKFGDKGENFKKLPKNVDDYKDASLALNFQQLRPFKVFRVLIKGITAANEPKEYLLTFSKDSEESPTWYVEGPSGAQGTMQVAPNGIDIEVAIEGVHLKKFFGDGGKITEIHVKQGINEGNKENENITKPSTGIAKPSSARLAGTRRDFIWKSSAAAVAATGLAGAAGLWFLTRRPAAEPFDPNKKNPMRDHYGDGWGENWKANWIDVNITDLEKFRDQDLVFELQPKSSLNGFTVLFETEKELASGRSWYRLGFEKKQEDLFAVSEGGYVIYDTAGKKLKEGKVAEGASPDVRVSENGSLIIRVSVNDLLNAGITKLKNVHVQSGQNGLLHFGNPANNNLKKEPVLYLATHAAVPGARLAKEQRSGWSRFISRAILAIAVVVGTASDVLGEIVRFIVDKANQSVQVDIDGKILSKSDLTGVVYQPTEGQKHISYYTDGHVAELIAPLLPANDPVLKKLGLSARGKDHGRILTKELGITNISLYYLPLENTQDMDAVDQILTRVHELTRTPNKPGLRVVAGNWTGLWDLPGSPMLTQDTPEQRNRTIESWRKQVQRYGKRPWLLYWKLGNETNYHVIGGPFTWKTFPMTLDKYYEFVGDVAVAIKKEETKLGPGYKHPVLLGNGSLKPREAQIIERVNEDKAVELKGEQPFDGLGLNVYPGVDFENSKFTGDVSLLGEVFNLAHSIGQPVVVTEMGIWAATPQDKNQVTFYGATHPHFVNSNWWAGLFLFSGTDELWKPKDSGRQTEAQFGIIGKLFHKEGGLLPWFKDGGVPQKKSMTPPSKTTPAEKGKTATQKKSSALDDLEGKQIAGSPSGDYSGAGAYSVWATGSFNLSNAQGIRIIFPESQAGINVRVRLLPKGGRPDTELGASPQTYTIPSDGILNIPISDFPAKQIDLPKTDQISVHSGSNAWSPTKQLNSSPDKKARFRSIEEIPKDAKKKSGARLAMSRRDVLKVGGAAIVAAGVHSSGLDVFGQSAGQSRGFVPAGFEVSAEEIQARLRFQQTNVDRSGTPKSYLPSKEYWEREGHDPKNVDQVIERYLTTNGISIYDVSTAMITGIVGGDPWALDHFIEALSRGSYGGLQSIRADNIPGPLQYFKYGEKAKRLRGRQAFVFRMLTADGEFLQTDPLNDATHVEGYPPMLGFEEVHKNRIHHVDWKPIAGENAWTALIAPLQVAYAKYGKNISYGSSEVQLAVDILTAVEAMQSDEIGAIYHAPEGTDGKDKHDISNENNISMVAGLKMLIQVLRMTLDKINAETQPEEQLDRERRDERKKEIENNIKRAERVLYGDGKGKKGIYDYFKDWAYNKETGVMHQGGFYFYDDPNLKTPKEKFSLTKDFAVDVQTWGISVFGPEQIDKWYGEGAALKMWEETKKLSGFYQNGQLKGVGFSNSDDVLSSEWTFGAIQMVLDLARYYEKKNPGIAKRLVGDAQSMRKGIDELLKVKLEDGSMAYLYANKRYYIRFGWWANRVPSLVGTTWATLVDTGFNPFILGGGVHYKKPDLQGETSSLILPSSKLKLNEDKEIGIREFYHEAERVTVGTRIYREPLLRNLSDYKSIRVRVFPQKGQTRFRAVLTMAGLNAGEYGGVYRKLINVPLRDWKEGEYHEIMIDTAEVLGDLRRHPYVMAVRFDEGKDGGRPLVRFLNKDNDEKTTGPHYTIEFSREEIQPSAKKLAAKPVFEVKQMEIKPYEVSFFDAHHQLEMEKSIELVDYADGVAVFGIKPKDTLGNFVLRFGGRKSGVVHFMFGRKDSKLPYQVIAKSFERDGDYESSEGITVENGRDGGIVVRVPIATLTNNNLTDLESVYVVDGKNLYSRKLNEESYNVESASFSIYMPSSEGKEKTPKSPRQSSLGPLDRLRWEADKKFQAALKRASTAVSPSEASFIVRQAQEERSRALASMPKWSHEVVAARLAVTKLKKTDFEQWIVRLAQHISDGKPQITDWEAAVDFFSQHETLLTSFEGTATAFTNMLRKPQNKDTIQLNIGTFAHVVVQRAYPPVPLDREATAKRLGVIIDDFDDAYQSLIAELSLAITDERTANEIIEDRQYALRSFLDLITNPEPGPIRASNYMRDWMQRLANQPPGRISPIVSQAFDQDAPSAAEAVVGLIRILSMPTEFSNYRASFVHLTGRLYNPSDESLRIGISRRLAQVISQLPEATALSFSAGQAGSIQSFVHAYNAARLADLSGKRRAESGTQPAAASARLAVREEINQILNESARPNAARSREVTTAARLGGRALEESQKQILTRFFEGVAVAFSLLSINNKALALELPQPLASGQAVPVTTVFRITSEGNKLVAVSNSGLLKVDLDVREARQHISKSTQALSEELGINDIALVEKAAGAKVAELLSNIDSTIPVVVMVNVGAFNNKTYEYYGSRLATAAISLRKENIRILPVGSAELIDRLYYFDSRSNIAFIRESGRTQALKEGARLAYLTLPGEWNAEATNIPLAHLEPGDIPAFEASAKLAAAGARLGKSSMPDSFRRAWEILAGLKNETLDPKEARDVMEGRASRQLGARLSLKPLLHALLDVTLRVFEMAKRQVQQAA